MAAVCFLTGLVAMLRTIFFNAVTPMPWPGGAALPIHNLCAQVSPAPGVAETPTERDLRMQWWREARFGMFIHWGVYSVPAGDLPRNRQSKTIVTEI